MDYLCLSIKLVDKPAAEATLICLAIQITTVKPIDKYPYLTSVSIDKLK